ncbi:MAG: TM0106 family RecB-like putative nuclease [Dehalococcoidia bacterium]
MRKNYDGTISFAPSDLNVYMGSPFASWMARLSIHDPERLKGIEKDHDEMDKFLSDKGKEHEDLFLKYLREEYGAENVAEIEEGSPTAMLEATITAMEAGYKVIFQAYLERDHFRGKADFLVRREGKSKLGAYHYEAWDTKLAKTTRPYFLVQLCCYSWMLEKIQGKVPEETVVVLGDKTKDRFRIAAYYSYFQNLKQQFLQVQENFTGTEDTMPDLSLETNFGAWGNYAQQLLDQLDSLALVANIRKKQIQHLHKHGVTTLTQLAKINDTEIEGISPESLAKIKAQADIQLRSRGQDKPYFKVIENDNRKGLSSLPEPSDLDMFFDIEGNPFGDNGLEYLWGVSYHNPKAAQGKEYAFKDWWAHDQKQEQLALEGFIDWTYQRWQQDKTMHVYHYANYEIAAIRKLSTRNQTRLDEVSELLENGVFIDLFKVVKNGLLIGEPSYSIKNVEHLYRGIRTTDVASGDESIIAYENWREAGGAINWEKQENGYKSWLADSDNFNWTVWESLEKIRNYNIDDCESTLQLADWLREQQQEFGISYSPVEEVKSTEEKTDVQVRYQVARELLFGRQQALVERFQTEEKLNKDPIAELLTNLLHFHVRERQTNSWAYYDRLEKDDEQLFDDDTVIFDITVTETNHDQAVYLCKGTYNPDQSIRTDKIENATIQGTDVQVSDVIFTQDDKPKGEISFKIKVADEVALEQSPLTLFGNDPFYNTSTLENKLCEITENYFEKGLLSGATATILNQDNPEFATLVSPLPVSRAHYPDANEYIQAMIATIEAMDNTCLCIQGPPGSGKTYTAKNVIAALVKNGQRIGIMSNSHAAIMNLLEDLPELLPDSRLVKVGNYGSLKDWEELDLGWPPNFLYRPTMSFKQNEPYGSFDVIGATVWGFAKSQSDNEEPVDYLFVDEASQVALANLVVGAGAAKNIVLMGDQMQLAQPIQASHPGKSGESALEFMLKGAAVIPDDQGVFLERSFRMHPDVCQPLSEIVYEGKLHADKDNTNQSIDINQATHITKPNGVLSIPVQHAGNTQSSEEEVIVVQQLINELKTGTFTDKEGNISPITDNDILIIAPYNMQVNLLKEKLKGDFNVSTIDGIQGQEAPVVIISMTASDVAESSRGLDFVFDINRLNVAVSRAQALAVIVASEGLEKAHVHSVKQMERVGFFTKLTETLDTN